MGRGCGERLLSREGAGKRLSQESGVCAHMLPPSRSCNHLSKHPRGTVQLLQNAFFQKLLHCSCFTDCLPLSSRIYNIYSISGERERDITLRSFDCLTPGTPDIVASFAKSGCVCVMCVCVCCVCVCACVDCHIRILACVCGSVKTIMHANAR